MTKIISTQNHKGGAGKTTTTSSLGAALQILGYRVLLIDCDPQSNLSQNFGREDEPLTIVDAFAGRIDFLPIVKLRDNLDLVPATLGLSEIEAGLYSNINNYFLLKTLLSKIKSQYDYVLIDNPPSLGIFTQNSLISSSSVLITVPPHYLAIKGLGTINELIATVRKELNPSILLEGILITQATNTNLTKEVVAALRAEFGDNVFKTIIRQNVAIAEASLNRVDVFSYAPTSNGASDYMSFAKELIK
jgi:chromosome partitioning protein